MSRALRPRRPVLLDLFCGAGGAAVGYHQAGFDVVGMDINPQPHYPYHAVQVDVMRYLEHPDRISGFVRPDSFDAIHASPPCQHHTKYRNVVKDITDRYQDHIGRLRELLEAVGRPYIIENVEGAPLHNPITLCGSMFDLDVRRHRLFETNWDLPNHPWGCRHRIWGRRFKASTGRKPDSRYTIEIGAWNEPLALQKACMGVDWTISLRELSEAVPPAYTEHIGTQLLHQLELAA